MAELKRILASSRRGDFYRCVTEKMLVFALGRGLEMQDEWTVERIVQKLEADGGKFSTLLSGVVNSAPSNAADNSLLSSTFCQIWTEYELPIQPPTFLARIMRGSCAAGTGLVAT